MEDIESAMHLREEVSFTINRKATELRIVNEKLKLANGGDRTMITQIFSNVMSNAVKYSSKSTYPRVIIEGKKVERGIQYVVRDNGIGIKPEETYNIFELFSRLENAHEFEGSGVGLAIIKKLVKKHKGEVWVESEPGRGTSFYILFKNQPEKAGMDT